MLQSFSLLASPSTTAEQFRLTGGNASRDESPFLMIQLTDSDLNSIKALTTLAISVESTYIAFFSGAVMDLSNQNVRMLSASNAIRASTFTPDTTDPRLNSFVLDLNEGTIVFTFSETVNASSFDLTGVVLQSVQNAQQGGTSSEPRRLSQEGASIFS